MPVCLVEGPTVLIFLVEYSLHFPFSSAILIGGTGYLYYRSSEVSLPLSVMSLAYIVSQPFPAYAISGCSNMEQLRENLRAGDVQLEPALLDYLDG